MSRLIGFSMYLFGILSLLNSICIYGTYVDLFDKWLWYPVAILLAFPATVITGILLVFISPWFDAWVLGREVDSGRFYIWLAWLISAVFYLISMVFLSRIDDKSP